MNPNGMNQGNNLNGMALGYFDPTMYKYNVLGEADYMGMYRHVFMSVSEVLKATFGPYGKTTIIEEAGATYSTKDGFNVLKRIRFNDNILNTIMRSLLDISNVIITRVGDGSTTSIIAAQQIFNVLENDPRVKGYRSKEFLQSFNNVIDLLQDRVLAKATPIDMENIDKMYDLAMISSNNDEEISKMVYDIYKKYESPCITYQEAKTIETTCNTIEGYEADIVYMDEVYRNTEDGSCEVHNPLILMIDHTVEFSKHGQLIQDASVIAGQEGRRLVVIADYIDQRMQQAVSNDARRYMSAGQEPPIVWCKVMLSNSMDKQFFYDFSLFTGGTPIGVDDFYEQDPETMVMTPKTDFDVSKWLGRTKFIRVGENSTLITGFDHKNTLGWEKTLENAKVDLQKAVDKNANLAAARFLELHQLKLRYNKLRGVISNIFVGGFNPLERKANLDMVEDVVKACEAAYKYGYNIGGSLIIPIAIKDLLADESVNLNTIEEEILDLLDRAFREVFAVVIHNKDEEIDAESIIKECVDKETCYDLLTDEYSNRIINPTITDVEMLRATTSIIVNLFASNQFISAVVNNKISLPTPKATKNIEATKEAFVDGIELKDGDTESLINAIHEANGAMEGYKEKYIKEAMDDVINSHSCICPDVYRPKKKGLFGRLKDAILNK